MRQELNAGFKELNERMETKHKELFSLQEFTQKNIDRQITDFAKILEQLEKKVSYMIRDFAAKELKHEEKFENLNINIENIKF